MLLQISNIINIYPIQVSDLSRSTSSLRLGGDYSTTANRVGDVQQQQFIIVCHQRGGGGGSGSDARPPVIVNFLNFPIRPSSFVFHYWMDAQSVS